MQILLKSKGTCSFLHLHAMFKKVGDMIKFSVIHSENHLAAFFFNMVYTWYTAVIQFLSLHHFMDLPAGTEAPLVSQTLGTRYSLMQEVEMNSDVTLAVHYIHCKCGNWITSLLDNASSNAPIAEDIESWNMQPFACHKDQSTNNGCLEVLNT